MPTTGNSHSDAGRSADPAREIQEGSDPEPAVAPAEAAPGSLQFPAIERASDVFALALSKGDPVQPLAPTSAFESTALVVAAATERHWLNAGTHMDAHEFIARAAQRIAASTPEGPDAAKVCGPSSHSAALLPLPAATSLVGQSLSTLSRTPLEDLRASLGLDQIWQRGISLLINQLEVKTGLKKLDRWTKAHADGARCRNLAEARALFPNLTVIDIAFLSLVSPLPDTYLLAGTGFAAGRAMDHHSPGYLELGDNENGPHWLVPMQIAMRTDGILFGDDRSDLTNERDLNLRSGANPDDGEVVPYANKIIAHTVRELTLLSISSARLFERLRKNATDALTVGVGLIKREALKRTQAAGDRDTSAPTAAPETSTAVALFPQTFELALVRSEDAGGLGPIPGTIDSITRRVGDLNGLMRATQAENEQAIFERIYRAKVSDDLGTELPISDKIRLIGLLDALPRCLFQDTPFQGSALLYGGYLIFADASGTIQETCRLSFECQRLLRFGLADELNDTSVSNRSMAAIERALIAGASTRFLAPLLANAPQQRTALPCSIMEEASIRAYQKHGVSIMVLGDHTIVSQNSATDAENRPGGLRGSASVEFAVKIGRDESLMLRRVLDCVGTSLLSTSGVRSIVKRQVSKFPSEMINRFEGALVRHNPQNHTIEIQEVHLMPYGGIKPSARANRAFEVARAVGEALWETLPQSERTWWSSARSVSLNLARRAPDTSVTGGSPGQALPPALDRPGFVWPFAAESDRADFSGHFGCFIVANGDFSALALRDQLVSVRFKWLSKFAVQYGVDLGRLESEAVRIKDMFGGILQDVSKIPPMAP